MRVALDRPVDPDSDLRTFDPEARVIGYDEQGLNPSEYRLQDFYQESRYGKADIPDRKKTCLSLIRGEKNRGKIPTKVPREA